MYRKEPVTDFLAARRQGIGGSDSSVVLGVNPYKDIRRLYFEKRGLFNAPFDTPAIQRGKALEPLIAAIFEKETGLTCAIEPDALVDDSQPWFRGNIDRWLQSWPGDPFGVLEIKSVGMEAFRRIRECGVDQHHVIQLQHYLELTGMETGFIIAHNAEKWEHYIVEVMRDKELGDIIREADRKFWQRVMNGDEPPLMPPAVLQVTPQMTTQDSPEWMQAVRDYLDASQIIKDADALKADAKARMMEMMGAFGIAETPGMAKVYWKQTPPRMRTDIENLLADNPQINAAPYQTYGEASEMFRVYPANEGR